MARAQLLMLPPACASAGWRSPAVAELPTPSSAQTVQLKRISACARQPPPAPASANSRQQVPSLTMTWDAHELSQFQDMWPSAGIRTILYHTQNCDWTHDGQRVVGYVTTQRSFCNVKHRQNYIAIK